MDRGEHPQLPPRSGAVPQLPPRPRPVPSLPPRQAISSPTVSDSTENHGYRQNNAEHCGPAIVSDELQSDALGDAITQFDRLKTTPEINVNSTQPPDENLARRTKTDFVTSKAPSTFPTWTTVPFQYWGSFQVVNIPLEPFFANAPKEILLTFLHFGIIPSTPKTLPSAQIATWFPFMESSAAVSFYSTHS